MGIRDLWTHSSEDRITFMTAVVVTRFIVSALSRYWKIPRCWGRYELRWASKARTSHSHAQLGQNPELRNIFQWLSRMSTLPIVLVAVFNGPGRPSRKRNMAVSKTPHWMTKRSQEILQAFGYHYYMVCAYALLFLLSILMSFAHRHLVKQKAELAYLNRSHCIDAVLTDDSDVLVFGATWVIRNPHDKTDLDKVYSYKASDFETQATTPIMRDGLLLFAVLQGGDYEKPPFDGQLMTIALQKLHHFLDGQWRDDLVYQLEHDPYAFIGRKNPKLASGIPLHFPDITTVLQYVTPLISTSSSLAVAAGLSAVTEIDALFLISLCMQLFGWENKATATQFRKHVWPSVCTHQLLKGSASHVAGLDLVKCTKTGIALLAREQHQTPSVACKIALLYEAFGQSNLHAVVVSSHPSSIPFIVDLTEESDNDVETAGQDEIIDLTALHRSVFDQCCNNNDPLFHQEIEDDLDGMLDAAQFEAAFNASYEGQESRDVKMAGPDLEIPNLVTIDEDDDNNDDNFGDGNKIWRAS
ncbi:hypothetical protein K435DRAFT_850772 [Dendrothele bispora CBS 962.96]|uniref:XPG-I domain-containing protein n=1 Tax=Dendrothele bispora (strain CBS 962.96) TaxID=1314807 RepID=A0A4S8MPK7_DENBC|nr:hypothetical protein K435DRAFT_850772 [Dendrothele bispora CBS 962.96]